MMQAFTDGRWRAEDRPPRNPNATSFDRETWYVYFPPGHRRNHVAVYRDDPDGMAPTPIDLPVAWDGVIP